MSGRFEDLEVGQVISLGAAMVDPAAMAAFIETFAPGWDVGVGAPDAMIYAIWSKLDRTFFGQWPDSTKRLAVDGLRWARNPPPGELLHGRLTIMGMDRVGENKGVVMAAHDLLDESGRLVFSCLTRDVYSCAN